MCLGPTTLVCHFPYHSPRWGRGVVKGGRWGTGKTGCISKFRTQKKIINIGRGGKEDMRIIWINKSIDEGEGKVKHKIPYEFAS